MRTEEELRAALADDNCLDVGIFDGVELVVEGDLTVTKGLSLPGSSSLVMSGDLTLAGSDAYFFIDGPVDMGGHTLNVLDDAVVIDRFAGLHNVGGVTVGGGEFLSRLLVVEGLELLPGAKLTVQTGGRVVNLGWNLELEQVSLDLAGDFLNLHSLTLTDCTVDINGGYLETRYASCFTLDSTSTLNNRGTLTLDGWQCDPIHLEGTVNNYGTLVQIHCGTQDDPLVSGVLNNYGTLNVYRSTYVTGALNNYGTVKLEEEGSILPVDGGVYKE